MKKPRVTITMGGDLHHSKCMYTEVDLHIGSD